MSWEKELSQRLQRVLPLSEKCIKYVKAPEQTEEELLVHKVLLSLAKKICEKHEPVKLRGIVEGVFGLVTKRNLDVVRLLIGKTLIPCGIVEKLYTGKRDVRYMLRAYRFQEAREVRLSSGQIVKEPVGPPIEIPREYFPISPEIIQLLLEKKSLDHVLSKLDEDFGGKRINEALYRKIKAEYEDAIKITREKLKKHSEILSMLGIEY